MRGSGNTWYPAWGGLGVIDMARRKRTRRYLAALAGICLPLLVASCTFGGASPTATPDPGAAAQAGASSPTPPVAVATPTNAPASTTRPETSPGATAGARSTPVAGSPLPGSRIVTYYGHPTSELLGVLGEYPPAELAARLKRQAAAYQQADPSKPVIPAIHFIATVAQGAPGNDGLYRAQTADDLIEKYAQLCEKEGMLLILDLQMGRAKVKDEVDSVLHFLKRPYVHLALDPEFTMGPGQIPGDEIGSIDAADINATARTLADLAATYNLPDKMLIVHQFLPSMIKNKPAIQSIPRVGIVVMMDGFGGPDLKTDVYNKMVRDQPVQYAGIKLFYKHDKPLFSPSDVLALKPQPDVITYQ